MHAAPRRRGGLERVEAGGAARVPDEAQRGSGTGGRLRGGRDVGVAHAQEHGLGIGAGSGGVLAARGGEGEARPLGRSGEGAAHAAATDDRESGQCVGVG